MVFIGEEIFSNLFDQNPKFARFVATELANMHKESLDMNFHLKTDNSLEKSMSGLKKISTLVNSKTLSANLKREDFASYFGLATETFIRQLTELKSDGKISMQGKKICIRF